mgnify:CR=1 FL=1
MDALAELAGTLVRDPAAAARDARAVTSAARSAGDHALAGRAEIVRGRAMLLLGNVYAQDLENEDGARKMYQQLLAKEPQHPQATAIRYWLSEHP